MDFQSALANLQKTANAAAANSSSSQAAEQQNRGSGGKHPNDRRRGRPEDNPELDGGRRKQRPRHRGGGGTKQQQRPLDAMQRFGYRVGRYRPSSYPSDLNVGTNNKRPYHIALLAITIDELPYEHIWKAWVQTGTAYVSLLCHAKFPGRVASPFLKQRLLTLPPRRGRGNSYADPVHHSHVPAWGSVEITRAMIDLLLVGMKVGQDPDQTDFRFSSKRYFVTGSNIDAPKQIPPVDKFIFISETCVPVTTLQECEESLFEEVQPKAVDDDDDAPNTAASPSATTTTTTRKAAAPHEVSWVNARNRNSPGTPKNKYERDQFNNIHSMVPQQYRWKADQWMVLSRPHADAVLSIDQHHMRCHDQLWQSFTKINASDEMYFPTALALAGILTEENAEQQVAKRAVTFTDWSEGMRNPASYSKGIHDFCKVARRARDQGCLFARKFVPSQQVPGAGEAETTGQIAARARVQGCSLFSSKFVPSQQQQQQIPGGEAETATGQITVEDWRREVDSLAAMRTREGAITKAADEKSG